MTQTEFKIPTEQAGKFQQKLDKLNRVAAKLGVEPITYKVLRKEMLPEKEGGKETGLFIETTIYEVTGKAPVLGGWTFAATVQHSHQLPIVRKAGEFEIPQRYYTVDATLCEQCGVRRDRVDTYIVKNVDNEEFKIVGSNCLKDFLGHVSPQAIARWMEYLTDLEGHLGGGFGEVERKVIPMNAFAAYVAREIRTNKFVSRKMKREAMVPDGTLTTGDIAVGDLLRAADSPYKVYPSADDNALAERAIEWMKKLDPSKGDFYYNLTILAHAQMLEFRDIGMVAAGVFMYRKATEAKAESTDLNEWYGKVGEKIDIPVKIVHTRMVDSAYGATQMFIFKHAETGQKFTWFSSGKGHDEVLSKYNSAEEKKKMTFQIVGKIKAHKTYKEEKQTALTRVKFTKVTYG